MGLIRHHQVAFAYFESSAERTPLSVVLWKGGAQLGDTITYPLTDPDWDIHISRDEGFHKASGAVAGTVHYHPQGSR